MKALINLFNRLIDPQLHPQIQPMGTRTVYPVTVDLWQQLTPTERYNLAAVTAPQKALHTAKATSEKDEALRKKISSSISKSSQN